MATWPALSWEDQLWMPVRRAFGTATDRYTSQPERYRSAVPAAIAARTPALDRETQQLAEGAAIELSRFDAELGERIASFAPVLLRSEAAASSRIENLTASARQILTAELGARAGRNATEIVANTRAMQAAIDLADTVNAAGIRQMHAVLMEGQSHHTPGRWREEPVWIGTRSDSPIGADYVAPEHTLIGKLMDDLVEFMQRFDLPALVTVSIAHAQFETIHPFTDGNGRTGRALAQSLLRHRQVTRNVAVPVSAGLLADVGGYYHALTAYRAGDPAPIVRSFADASWRAVENARALVTELDALRVAWGTRVAARRDSGVWQLLDVLIRRPVLDARAAAQELGVHVPNVYPHLNKLAGVGILRRKTEHEFGPVWRADEALAAVDAFAERAGRRARS